MHAYIFIHTVLPPPVLIACSSGYAQVRLGVSKCQFVAFWPSCPDAMPSNPSQSDKRKFMMLHYNAHALDCVTTFTASSRASQAVAGEVRECTLACCESACGASASNTCVLYHGSLNLRTVPCCGYRASTVVVSPGPRFGKSEGACVHM